MFLSVWTLFRHAYEIVSHDCGKVNCFKEAKFYDLKITVYTKKYTILLILKE